ncbi:Gfo/Idh/MocA family oxidoreductase [soil metagenome]
MNGGPGTVLVGVAGYGRVHLDGIMRAHHRGDLTLVGVVDPLRARLDGVMGLVPGGVRRDQDLGRALDALAPDVVVVAAPPHVHRTLVEQVAGAGAHVLVEKPPAVTVADLDAMTETVRAAAVRCQVNFTHAGCSLWARLRRMVANGVIGDVRHVAATGAWQRTAAYYQRAGWAGRLRLGATPVLDGTVMNPFAHALFHALDVAGWPELGGGQPASLEAELYRAHDIEGDDTSSLRIATETGLVVVVATTLCATHEVDPCVRVHGSRGTAAVEYRTDTLVVEVDGRPPVVHRGRTIDLLDDLLEALAVDHAPACPLERTRTYLDAASRAYLSAGRPRALPVESVRRAPLAGGDVRVTVPGIEALIARCGQDAALLSELGVTWARPGRRVTFDAPPAPVDPLAALEEARA